MRKALISLLLFLPSSLLAQSVRYQSQLIGSRGTPLAFQNVAVCNQPASTGTTPCSPLATLATSTSTTSGGPNPLTTDINGNFFFYAAPGRYTIQIYGPQIVTPFVQPDTNIPLDPTLGTFTTLQTFTAGLTSTVAGSFNNLANNEYTQGIVNGCSASAEFTAAFGGAQFTTDALTGCIYVPVGATQTNSNAVAGYARNSSTGSNAVAGFFLSRCIVNSSLCWGVNPVVSDVPSVTNTILKHEFDCNINNVSTSGQCIEVAGAFSAQPSGFFPAYQVARPVQVGGGGLWTQGLLVNDGAVLNGIAMFLGTAALGNSQPSQSVVFNGRDSGGVVRTGSINVNQFGDFSLIPASGRGVAITGSLTVNGSPVAGSGFTGVNVTPVTVSANTSSDQNLMAITITAGALNSASRTMLVQLAGVYSTPAASTTTLTHKIKLCTVSGCGSGTVLTLASWTTSALGGIQATNNPYNAVTNFSTQTAGASAAFESHGNLTIDLAALAAAAESVFADNNTATIGTIDSTAQLFLQHTVSFSAASASNSATDRQLIADTVD